MFRNTMQKQPRINLIGTEERASIIENNEVLIENIAYDKNGNEIIVATRVETLAMLESRKSALETQLTQLNSILSKIGE